MASEGEDNYDEYMLSADEAMGSASDLEFESDGEEPGEGPGGGQNGEGSRFEDVRDAVEAYMSERRFAEAREALLRAYEGVQTQNKADLALLLVQIWSARVQYTPIGSLGGADMLEQDLNMVLQGLVVGESLPECDQHALLGAVGSLVLGPAALSLYRLLFALMDAPGIDTGSMLHGLGFYKTVIAGLEWLGALGPDTPPWVADLCRLLRYKSLYIESLEAVLAGQTLPVRMITDLQLLIDSSHGDMRVQALFLQLQMFLYNFLQQGASQHDRYRQHFENSIGALRECVTASLALQQDPQLTLVLHMASGVHFLPRNEYDRDDEDFEQYGAALPGQLTSFLDRISACRSEFLAALEKLDEIGYSASASASGGDHIQLFHRLILCVFVMTSMVVQRHAQRLDVSAFNYEPVRVWRHHPFMQGLERMHARFIALDLVQLYKELQTLGPLARILRYMSARTMRLAQTFKLWTQIAPNYSCVALEDLRRQLSYSETAAPVSRDDVLTILMRSILKGKAAVYFKIDFVADLVHFGDELKVPVAVYPREHHFHRGNTDKSGSAPPPNLDFANDTDVFSVETRRLPASDSPGFFAQLRQNRAAASTAGPSQSARAHERYLQLVGMATASIDRLK